MVLRPAFRTCLKIHWCQSCYLLSHCPTIHSALNVWWGNVKEDNSFGTNEFLNMCEMLGAEPYLSGNVGSGSPQELSDWVKYTTHPAGSSPMPDLRAKYGRQNPWHVK